MSRRFRKLIGHGGFLTDNLFDSGKGTFSVDTESWAPVSGNTIAVVGGELAVTYVNNAHGARLFLNDAADLSSDLTPGVPYTIQFTARGTTGVNTRWAISYDGGSTVAEQVDVLGIVNSQYEIIFTPTSATNTVLRNANIS